MWIIFSILAAFFNSFWTALSKRQLGELSPYHFTLLFRTITTFILLPVFLIDFKISNNPIFWLAVIGAGTLEVVGIYFQSRGIQKDFYSTYSLSNTTPIFTLLFAPFFVSEKISFILFLGVLLMVIGGMIEYHINPRTSIYGIIRAASAAINGILAKIAIQYSSGWSYPFITFTIGILIMVLVSPLREEKIDWNLFKPFTKKLLPLSLYSAIATILYYIAVESAPITKVNPLIRINVLFGFVLSYYLLKENEHIGRKIIAGILIILGSIFIAIA